MARKAKSAVLDPPEDRVIGAVNFGEEILGSPPEYAEAPDDFVVGAAVTPEEWHADPEPSYSDVMGAFSEVGAEGAEEAEGPPEPKFKIPTDEDFAAQKERDYIFDFELEEAGRKMIAAYPELTHLDELRLRFAWKRRGGTSQGKPNLGGLVRGNALLRALGETDYVFWLAADNCRQWLIETEHRDAALYHQMCHASIDEFGKPENKAHEVEMFTSEVQRFGLWSIDLKRAARDMVPVFEQASLEL